ncbi:MAG: hypothetical protein HS100_18640 [Anaerolineales bacterium]|nr:hypothetical protein [Anaerolineales bacterium]
MSSNQSLLEQLTKKKSVLDWFKGLFTQVHLEITDTGEKFTILHHGDSAEVVSGFHAKKPNFIIPLKSENVGNLVRAFSDDRIDAQEEYRIVKFMMVPCLRAALAMPILNNTAVHKIVKVDTHWQEVLIDPSGNEDLQLTIIYVNKQWLVIPGLYGTPTRRLALTPAQLLDFQRRVLAADASGKVSDWAGLAKWYVDWREEITVH